MRCYLLRLDPNDDAETTTTAVLKCLQTSWLDENETVFQCDTHTDEHTGDTDRQS